MRKGNIEFLFVNVDGKIYVIYAVFVLFSKHFKRNSLKCFLKTKLGIQYIPNINCICTRYIFCCTILVRKI